MACHVHALQESKRTIVASPSSIATASDHGTSAKEMPSLVVGDQIAAGTGGINQALAEGRGWSDEDVLAYAKTIGDNHPMFAETLEVRR